jgi:CBS domain-containing protein
VRIHEIMSSPAVVVSPDLPVHEAVATLDATGFTCLPVVAADGRLVGVVGEAELLAGRFPPDPRVPIFERVPDVPARTVGDVMVRDVFVTRPREGVADLLTVLRGAGLRSVPVVDDGIVVGVVTHRDLLRALARDDAAIEADVRRRLDIYGGIGRWRVEVRGGEVTIDQADPADPAELSGAVRVAESVLGVARCRVVERPAVRP